MGPSPRIVRSRHPRNSYLPWRILGVDFIIYINLQGELICVPMGGHVVKDNFLLEPTSSGNHHVLGTLVEIVKGLWKPKRYGSVPRNVRRRYAEWKTVLEVMES